MDPPREPAHPTPTTTPRNPRHRDAPPQDAIEKLEPEQRRLDHRRRLEDFKERFRELGEPVDAIVGEVEQRKHLTAEVLNILNRPGNTSERISEILHVVREYGNFDAVGIRLCMGRDFPSFVQEGFSEVFVQKEKSLCSLGPDGTLRLDDQGKPILECLCGLVLVGQTDPMNPCFTRAGSY